jgi:hydrophobe/amphiphile efflux-1 (HAE1) family protein
MWMTRIAISNPVFATMMMVALCVLGLFSYGRLGVEQMPDTSVPAASVDVRYPGAAPEAVEREVTRPIEETLNSIAGVRRITSRSVEGRSQTTVEFNLNVRMDRAVQEMRDRLAAIQGVLPREAKAPTVTRYSGNSRSVALLALMSTSRGSRELSLLADQTVLKRLQRVDGVANVEVAGTTTRELSFDLDPVRLRAYAITPAEIAQALREANADQPIGLLSSTSRDALLRVEGRLREARQFADVVVARRNGLPLTLADLGRLVEREREPDSLARINGRDAVTFGVYKQQDANMVTTGEAVKEAVADLRKTLPADVELRLIRADSDWVKASLSGVQRTLVEGAVLTLVIVFLFLHSWRSTIITGLTLPISVIASFTALQAFGFTLNFMTLMALSLSIGLLIDDAIVVRENIVRHLHMGKSHRAAARDGTDEIGIAVMATTFALCAVFVPVAFMGGAAGQFFYPFGVTVAVAVLVSLFVSFTLDPMLSAVWRDPPSKRVKRLPVIGLLIRLTDRSMDLLLAIYDRLIRWIFSDWCVLGFVRPRGVVLGVGILSFVVAIVLVPLAGTEFIPQTDQGYTQLQLRMPVGSSLARSDAKVRQVEEILNTFPEVSTLSTSIGGAGQDAAAGRNQATIQIDLKPRAERRRTQKQVEDAIREQVVRVAGIEITLGIERPISVTVLGTDAAGLARIVAGLADKMKQIPGIADVDVSTKPGLPAYAVRLKPDAMRELGLSTPQLAASLSAYVSGDVATRWTTPEGNQVDLLLRLPPQQRERVEQLLSLPVAFASDGTPIGLAAVAAIEIATNPEVISRQNLQRQESITAGVRGRPAGDVGADVQKLVYATTLPPGFSFDVGGDTKGHGEAFAALVSAMGLAVVFIYIVLASQFGSFLQPIAIMASLPLSLLGVMLALLLTGSTLNVFSMIGLVMLMGLVTKNAILLIDCANQARRGGASVAEALRQAGLARMRPIMMTTLAMVFGMLPLALALDEGGELQASMGRAIIGGVITSTLLTLVVVPVIYSFLARDRKARAPAVAARPALTARVPSPRD